MPARQFNYFDRGWKRQRLTCPRCGWSGTFNQGSVEHHEELMDSSCPKCPYPDAPMLAIVSYPTMEEAEANKAKLPQAERSALSRRKQFLARLDRESLKNSGQLPDLDGPEIIIQWDFEAEPGERNCRTFLRCGDRVLWSEPAVWEGFERYGEIVGILQAKYGRRLADVVPTPASTLYLYGDRLSAGSRVKDIRAGLHRRSATKGAQPRRTWRSCCTHCGSFRWTGLFTTAPCDSMAERTVTGRVLHRG